MTRYLLRRLLFLIPTVYLVLSLVFLLLHAVPGDPVDLILGEQALPGARQQLIHDLKLDRSLWVQHSYFIVGIFQGDLGKSLYDGTPVVKLIAGRWPATFQLTLAAMVIATGLAIPAGILAAVRRNGLWDQGAMLASLVGISVPGFYLGPLLILLFSIHLGWLPVAGNAEMKSILLPAVTLGAGLAAMITRMTRTAMLGVLKAEYVRTAKAKGLPGWKVVIKHAFRTALIPIVTVLGLQFGALLAGAVVTEKVFSWPGLGSLMLQAIQRRDYPVVQGCVLTIALTFILVNLCTDLTYRWIDPRIDLENRE